MSSPWTCPFCPLACDALAADLSLPGSAACTVATTMIGHAQPAATASPMLDGNACDLATATVAAAQRLALSRQPLIAGLGTDVAATRALYPLACASGAIVDAAAGDALMHGLRALQDRGQFTTTLAEVRTRADLIVFVGGLPGDVAPLVRQRLGIGEAQVAQRHVVVLGPTASDEATLAGWADAGVSVASVALSGDLFTTLSVLAARVAARLAGRSTLAVPAGLDALATRLQDARYGVLVGTPSLLPDHGALAVEVVHHIVGLLNKQTRAAALWLGGGNGVATANQVHAWLSGLPLRSRAGPRGLEHEPLLYGTQRLLAEQAVDALVWVSLFDPLAVPPPNDLPMVVLGPPAMAAACTRPGAVYIPVATPGIGAAGHVFRTDGTVLMPLFARRPETLPGAAEVVQGITRALLNRTAA